jgi:ankyrin repeat protein
MLAILIAAYSAVNGQSERNGRTPLFDAVRWDKADMTQELIVQGADPNHTNAWGQTPVHEAAIFACTNSLRVLLQNKAKTDIFDAAGNYPLHSAIMSPCPDGVKPPLAREDTILLLLQYGADPNAPKRVSFIPKTTVDSHVGRRPAQYPNKGNTPLSLARSNGFTNIVELLLEHGAYEEKSQPSNTTYSLPAAGSER